MPPWWFVAVLALLCAGCSGGANHGAPSGPGALATTSTLASLASGVTGAAVPSLVPIGVSPEDYQPAPHDIEVLHAARVLVENGTGLEAWLDPTIRNAANARLVRVVCTDGLPVREGNPHLWMDPEFACAYVAKIRDALVSADPTNAEAYRTNAAAYDAKLVALSARVRRKLAALPADHRTLIVFHNALDYYAARFGLHVVGAIEPTAGAEPNPSHIADLVRQARRYHVRAVFAEHEFSPKLAHALADEAGIRTVSYLYDDSVGTDPKVADYIGMIDFDTDAIVDALR
jgi:ABC-type Zn uptake system ZnuABC Zn-binding protein ZnuA